MMNSSYSFGKIQGIWHNIHTQPIEKIARNCGEQAVIETYSVRASPSKRRQINNKNHDNQNNDIQDVRVDKLSQITVKTQPKNNYYINLTGEKNSIKNYRLNSYKSLENLFQNSLKASTVESQGAKEKPNSKGIWSPKGQYIFLKQYFQKSNLIRNKQQYEYSSQSQSRSLELLSQDSALKTYSYFQIKRLPLFINYQILTKRNLSFLYERGIGIGQGYFGKVYLARNIETGAPYALKYIPQYKVIQQDNIDSIIQQIGIQNSFNSKNICQLYDAYYHNGNFVMVMELCLGSSLRKILKENHRLCEEQAASYISQLLTAINLLHSNQIVHGDIKAENIIIEQGVVKLCDFGHAFDEKTTQRKKQKIKKGGKLVQGTILYSAPQVIINKTYTKAMDIWAIGILTYELIVGLVPFKLYSENQVYKITHSQLRFPDYLDISFDTRDFIQRCLQKNPWNRAEIGELILHPFLLKKRRVFQSNYNFDYQLHEELSKILF